MYMARRPISLLLCTNGLRKRSSRADQGLSLGLEAAMLPGPRVETHPPPPVPPFLLAQNLSPKDIAGSDITS